MLLRDQCHSLICEYAQQLIIISSEVCPYKLGSNTGPVNPFLEAIQYKALAKASKSKAKNTGYLPSKTLIVTVGWLSEAVEKICDFLVGTTVFLGISLVMTPPTVSMPRVRGQTSSSTRSPMSKHKAVKT